MAGTCHGGGGSKLWAEPGTLTNKQNVQVGVSKPPHLRYYNVLPASLFFVIFSTDSIQYPNTFEL